MGSKQLINKNKELCELSMWFKSNALSDKQKGFFFQEEKSLTLLFFIRIKGHLNNTSHKMGYNMSHHHGVHPGGKEHKYL